MKYDKQNLIAQRNNFSSDDFVFFWGHEDREQGTSKVCLSQWFRCSFVVDGQYYNCAEQYMMAEKARIFGDEETRQQILSEYSQMAMKKLGRKVRNYNDFVWSGNRLSVVIEGNLAKFSQNESLREFLLSTGDKVLVEASPKDAIWGIGLDASSHEAIHPRNWQGDNLLGFALMEVRDILRGKIDEVSTDISKTLLMWTSGAGDSGRRFNGEDPMPNKTRVATAETWSNKPMKQYITIPQHFFLSPKQMDVIRYGHIPEAMEDHWFMFADNDSINYVRSWSGITIFKAKYEPFEDGYLITELCVNSNKSEYNESDDNKAIALFYAMLISEYGGDSGPYWNVAF